MDFFFIDYENVNVLGLNGLKNLTEEDVVVIFYSDKADTLTFGLHKRLNESRAEIRFQKVAVGTRNALDFQLSSYLGYVICQNAEKNATYYIVSKDRDYEVLSKYWKHRKITVLVSADLTKKPAPVEKPEKPKNAAGDRSGLDTLTEELATVLPEGSLEPAVVAGVIRACKTKMEVSNTLTREFQNRGYDQCTRHAGVVYRLIKPWLAGKPGG